MLIHHSLTHAQMPRVVVLGAGGFIGSNLVKRLKAQGAGVLPLTSAEVDLTSRNSVQKLRETLRPEDAVVFLSALTPDKGKDIRTSMRNLAMGEHVCEALSSAPAAHVIYISSDAVYDDDDTSPIHEGSPKSASTLYGLMHLMRERMLQQTLSGKDARLTILRPVALYGADDSHNAYGPNRFVRSALSTRKIELFGGGEEKRDHLMVDDFVHVLELALTHRSGGLVNVGSGSASSFFEVAELVRGLVGRDVVIQTSGRAAPVIHRHFDIAGLVRSFPSFRPTPVDQGLKRMVAAISTAG